MDLTKEIKLKIYKREPTKMTAAELYEIVSNIIQLKVDIKVAEAREHIGTDPHRSDKAAACAAELLDVQARLNKVIERKSPVST